MIKISIEKKAIADAAAVIGYAASLKSPGAMPAENSCLYLTPTTLTLYNTNEVNAVVVENIALAKVQGDTDIGSYCDRGIMVNTKKLAAVIKGCKDTVNIQIYDDKIVVGEGRRNYELSIYAVDRRSAPEFQLFDTPFKVKDVVKKLGFLQPIVENAHAVNYNTSAMFKDDMAMATDRTSAISIRKMELFGNALAGLGLLTDIKDAEAGEVMLGPDLFLGCLSKIDAEDGYVGITTDRDKIVVRVGNIIIYKSISSDFFPKTAVKKVMDDLNVLSADKIVNVEFSAKDFLEKLTDTRSIIESDSCYMTFVKGGDGIIIQGSNSKNGVGGEVVVPAKIEFPAAIAENQISASFLYAHMELIGKMFPAKEMPQIAVISNIVNATRSISYITVKTEELLFLCMPKAN